MATPEEYLQKAEQLGIPLSPDQVDAIYNGASLEDTVGKDAVDRANANAVWTRNKGFNPAGPNIGSTVYDPNAMSLEEQAMRKYAAELASGKYDLNLNALQTERTAGIPRQFAEMNTAQAAQMASNGLSGSGLADRAARRSKLDENSAWNSGMYSAQQDYQKSRMENQSKAQGLNLQLGDMEARRKAAAELQRQNRANEQAEEKNRPDAAGDFFSNFFKGWGF